MAVKRLDVNSFSLNIFRLPLRGSMSLLLSRMRCPSISISKLSPNRLAEDLVRLFFLLLLGVPVLLNSSTGLKESLL